MATVAAMLKRKGFEVSGSDQDVYPPMSDFLAAEGIPTLAALLEGFVGPVVFGFPTGHVVGPALTVPVGVRARLVAGETSRLVIEEAAVAA